jgi:hypothetical protein
LALLFDIAANTVPKGKLQLSYGGSLREYQCRVTYTRDAPSSADESF